MPAHGIEVIPAIYWKACFSAFAIVTSGFDEVYHNRFDCSDVQTTHLIKEKNGQVHTIKQANYEGQVLPAYRNNISHNLYYVK